MESSFLDSFEFPNKGLRDLEKPNSCICEKGPDKGHIGDKYSFLFLTPVDTSNSLEDVDTG